MTAPRTSRYVPAAHDQFPIRRLEIAGGSGAGCTWGFITERGGVGRRGGTRGWMDVRGWPPDQVIQGRVRAAEASPQVKIAAQFREKDGLRLAERHRDPGAGGPGSLLVPLLSPAGYIAPFPGDQQRRGLL